MPFKQKDLHIKNEEGSGLVLALMTLMVLSVLGASLGAITIGSYKLGDVNRDDTSAYYIAEAGANMAYEEIKAGVLAAYSKYPDSEGLFYNEIDDRINNNRIINLVNSKTYDDFDNQFGDSPTASISIPEPKGSNPKNYTIVSTGEVAGKSRTVRKSIEVTWVKRDEGGLLLPENTAFIANKTINYTQGDIAGDIYFESKISNSFIVSNYASFADSASRVYINPDADTDIFGGLHNNPPSQNIVSRAGSYEGIMDFESIWKEIEKIANDIPEYPDFEQNSVNNFVDMDVIDGKYINNTDINKLDVVNSDTIIKTHDEDISFSVKNFNLSNGKSLQIEGEGTVNIYVEINFDFSGGRVNTDSSSNNLNVYYYGKGNTKIDNQSYVNANIYINNSDTNNTNSSKLNISNGFITGNIISNRANITFSNASNNKANIIAPYSKVTWEGGANNKGVLLAENIEVSNGMGFSSNFENLPAGLAGSSSESTGTFSLDDLISSKPAIESE